MSSNDGPSGRHVRVPLVYRDARGELACELETNSRHLDVVIAGIRFAGELDGLGAR